MITGRGHRQRSRTAAMGGDLGCCFVVNDGTELGVRRYQAIRAGCPWRISVTEYRRACRRRPMTPIYVAKSAARAVFGTPELGRVQSNRFWSPR